MFLIAFAVTKERIQPDPQQETSVMQDLGRSDEERPVDRAVPGHDLLLYRRS